MCLSSLCFAIVQAAVRMTSDIPIMEQVFFRNIGSLIICAYIVRKNNGSYFGEKKYQPLLFMRSLFGFLGMTCLFYASSNAHQADVAIISKLSPFIVTILAAIFLKEKITKIQIPALLISFTGAAIVVNPSMVSNALPLIAAFLSAVTSSGSYTLLAYFNNKVDGMTVVVHFSAVCIAFTIPFMCFHFILPEPYELCLLLIIGIAGGIGQITLTYSYRMAYAGEISIYNYSGIIFSAILGYMLLDEQLKLNSLFGGALVIIAAFLVYRYSPEKKNEGENKESISIP